MPYVHCVIFIGYTKVYTDGYHRFHMHSRPIQFAVQGLYHNNKIPTKVALAAFGGAAALLRLSVYQCSGTV